MVLSQVLPAKSHRGMLDCRMQLADPHGRVQVDKHTPLLARAKNYTHASTTRCEQCEAVTSSFRRAPSAPAARKRSREKRPGCVAEVFLESHDERMPIMIASSFTCKRRHHGHNRVTDSPLHGTTFVYLFPTHYAGSVWFSAATMHEGLLLEHDDPLPHYEY